MSFKKDFPSKGILKVEHADGPNLGGYNLYTKRASFKADVISQQLLPQHSEATSPQPVIEKVLPIAPEETEKELSNEELRKQLEFKEKRLKLDLDAASGFDLKDILGHRVSLTPGINEDDEEEEAEVEAEESDDAVSFEQPSSQESGDSQLPRQPSPSPASS